MDKFQIDLVIASTARHLSIPRTYGDLSSVSTLTIVPSDSSDTRITPTDLSSVSLSVPIDLSSWTLAHSKRLDMWQPDTNGTMFRNDSITVAFNGINLDSPTWADPNVIPPWAFESRSEYERANPSYPVPGFDNDIVLVPLHPAQPFENIVTSQPTMPTMPTPYKPCTQRQRKAKRPSSIADEVNTSPKKSRPLLSFSLNQFLS